jgi:antitoxin Phd
MKTTASPDASLVSWSLREAKARFSELVRMVREQGPQRVTLNGRDAVVVVAAEDYDRAQAGRTGRGLIEAMAACPAADLDFERRDMIAVARPVEI